MVKRAITGIEVRSTFVERSLEIFILSNILSMFEIIWQLYKPRELGKLTRRCRCDQCKLALWNHLQELAQYRFISQLDLNQRWPEIGYKCK
jgi:hypothetical protein